MSYNVPAVAEAYEGLMLSWVKAAVTDGLAVLRREKAYNEFENAKKFINGEQYPLRSRSISRIVDNKLRKAMFETISAMTDVRPIWNYETNDLRYEDQAKILAKLAKGWWKYNNIDRRLQTVLTYSCVGGSGYGYLRFNPELPGGGDIEMIPMDPRDVIPIDPIFSDSIQDWRGVLIRQQLQVETLRVMYPTKAHKLGAMMRGSWFTPMTKEGGSIYNVLSSAWSVLTRGNEGRSKEMPNAVDIMYIFIKDESLNTGTEVKIMGEPGTNWMYLVPPMGSKHPITGEDVTPLEARLYPRGRLIVCTQDAVLSDGPNPYWHGMFPIVKFTLEPLPWTLLGAPIIADLIPLQNALNEGLRGIEDGMAQWLRRGIVADQHSLSKNTLEAMDSRKAGFKAYLNSQMGVDGFKILDGPNYPPWYMSMLDWFKNEIEENSGVKGLQAMAQLKQMPSADTIEKYLDAMSPLLRVRARSMEVSLGEMAEMLKVNFFQYYDAERRMQILGKDGLSLEDFDYDPGQLVPADPILGTTRPERAEKHHRNFKFSIAPNSFLSVSHTEQKMLVLQMFRDQIIDPYTLWEEMDIANTGPTKQETIPDRIAEARRNGLMQGPTPEVANLQAQVQQVQG
ncbi:MAG: hypothetical protein ACREIQ_10100, partial [Nitrospiria bacterium]